MATIVIRKSDGTKIRVRKHNGTRITVNFGVNIHPLFQLVLNVAIANGFTIPNITGLRAGSNLAKKLVDNGFFDVGVADVFFVRTWNNPNLENFSKICWKRLIVTEYYGGYSYTNLGVKGNAINAYTDYLWTPSVNAINYQLNNAFDIYYNANRQGSGEGTRLLEGSINSGRASTYLTISTTQFSRNRVNQGNAGSTVSQALVDLIIAEQHPTGVFANNGIGCVLKKRIDNANLYMADYVNEYSFSSNSTVLDDAPRCGLRETNSYRSNTEGLVYKGRGSFMTYTKFTQFRSILNDFLGDVNLPQNA